MINPISVIVEPDSNLPIDQCALHLDNGRVEIVSLAISSRESIEQLAMMYLLNMRQLMKVSMSQSAYQQFQTWSSI